MRIGILCLALLGIHVNAETLIEVFSDRPMTAMNIPNATVTVYDLSRAVNLESELPALSPNPEKAHQQAKAWLGSAEGKAHLQRLQKAYRGHEQMVIYGVQKIPAIVFEQGKYVVYGTTDIGIAVRDYDHFIQQRHDTESEAEHE